MNMSQKSRSLSQPNKRLKRERMLRGWTQVDLAGFVGTDGFTVNRWECGRTRPSSFFRQKLCEVFGKNAEDLGLLPTSQMRNDSHLLQGSNPFVLGSLPHLPNPFFTGRETLMEALHLRLSADQAAPYTQVCALRGLGGIGKTQLALEYAYRYAWEYSSIFWIEAETCEHILSSLRKAAESLHLPECEQANPQIVVKALQHWLASHDKWLLIWDNLEDLQVPQRLFPALPVGAMLITTRRQALGPLAQGLDLLSMEWEEALLLLLRRSRILEPLATSEQVQQFALSDPYEYAAACDLVAILGGLPLALDQAGAYIEETGCGFADYRQRYRQQRASLLARRGAFGEDHPHSVIATLVPAIEQGERVQRAAADVLCVCALLHADAIPEEVFLVGAGHLGPLLEPLASDPTQFDQIIAVLRSLSLVQRHSETHTLSLHPLVQVALQERMSEQERVMWLRRIIAALHALFPSVTSHTRIELWELCERLFPHVMACAAAALEDHCQTQKLVALLLKAADYIHERSRHEQAQSPYQQAPHIHRRMFGLNGPNSATLQSQLVHLYRVVPREQAEHIEPLLWEVCAVFEKQRPNQAHPGMMKTRQDYYYLLERRQNSREMSMEG